MKKLLLILTLFLFSCSNNETYKVSMDSVIICPDSIELIDYSGEVVDLSIKNPSAKALYLIPDISIYTKIGEKEYLVQRKNEVSIKPTASFTFSFGGTVSNSNSLGLTIESSREYLVFYQKDFYINPVSQKNIDFSINTNNLYYTMDKKNILVSNEELYGFISLYHDNNLLKAIPFKLKLKQP